MNMQRVVFVIVGILVLSFSSVDAQSPLPPPGAATLRDQPENRQKLSAVEKIGPGIFRLGDITINKTFKSVTFPALVNMDKGLLEYLLVFMSGKTHESLFRTGVNPYDLQVAFLLLGYEGTDKPLQVQGDPAKPKGEAVEILVSYQTKDGKQANIKAEDWVMMKTDTAPKAAGKMDWVYTGSLVRNGRLAAQQEGSLIAIYHDPVALIDNATTGGESDRVWFVKEGALPPVGTPVIINIRSVKK